MTYDIENPHTKKIMHIAASVFVAGSALSFMPQDDDPLPRRLQNPLFFTQNADWISKGQSSCPIAPHLIDKAEQFSSSLITGFKKGRADVEATFSSHVSRHISGAVDNENAYFVIKGCTDDRLWRNASTPMENHILDMQLRSHRAQALGDILEDQGVSPDRICVQTQCYLNSASAVLNTYIINDPIVDFNDNSDVTHDIGASPD